MSKFKLVVDFRKPQPSVCVGRGGGGGGVQITSRTR